MSCRFVTACLAKSIIRNTSYLYLVKGKMMFNVYGKKHLSYTKRTAKIDSTHLEIQFLDEYFAVKIKTEKSFNALIPSVPKKVRMAKISISK